MIALSSGCTGNLSLDRRAKISASATPEQSVEALDVAVVFGWRVYPMSSGSAFHGVGSNLYLKRDGAWEEVLEHKTVTLTDEPPGSGRRHGGAEGH